MTAVLEKLAQERGPNDPEYCFHCPGCGCCHWFKTTGDRPRWEWNGSMDKPTVSPSILVQWTRYEPPATTPEIVEKIRLGEIIQTPVKKVCHSFVRDGAIQFLNDCTHHLAGQTVPLESV
jgi:hypothetical protein